MILDISPVFSNSAPLQDTPLAPAIHHPSHHHPLSDAQLCQEGKNGVPLKSVHNQSQLIPLLSLIISIVDHIPLISLLTRALAPAKVMLGQAK